MFCPKCGNEIKGNEKFCGKCGTAIDSVASDKEKYSYNPAPNMPLTDTKAESDNIKALKTAKSEAGIVAQKVIAEAGNAASGIWSKLHKWLTNYLDTWRQLQKLGEKEKHLWFGIHAGVALLFVCIMLVPVFASGRINQAGSDKSGRNTKKTSIKEAYKKALEDDVISEEEITILAQSISNYEEWQQLEQWRWEDWSEYFNIDGFPNFPNDVWYECIRLSGMLENFDAWYDQDGLTEKIFGCSDRVKYIMFSRYGAMEPVGVDSEADFRQNGSQEVQWFTCADSNTITFIKTIYVKSTSDSGYEMKDEVYDGKFEISGTELLVTLDGKQYHLTEANTDIAKQQEESFQTMSKGDWAYSKEFCDMIASNLGNWEIYEENLAPLYISFSAPGSGLTIRGAGGVYIAHIKDSEYKQGEGKVVTISSKNGSLEVSYDKIGNNLVITVNGIDYTLSSTSSENTGTYDDFGERVR